MEKAAQSSSTVPLAAVDVEPSSSNSSTPVVLLTYVICQLTGAAHLLLMLNGVQIAAQDAKYPVVLERLPIVAHDAIDVVEPPPAEPPPGEPPAPGR